MLAGFGTPVSWDIDQYLVTGTHLTIGEEDVDVSVVDQDLPHLLWELHEDFPHRPVYHWLHCDETASIPYESLDVGSPLGEFLLRFR
jgi:hypothetical protein